MRAVNLIPPEARGGRGGVSGGSFGPAFAVLAVLALALALVTYYVLTSNTISSRRAQLVSVQAQVTQAQAQASQLGAYASFVKLAQARTQTVRQIAAGRFDWHAALSDLSHVVPANASLQSLLATATPGASASGGGTNGSGATASTSSLRGNIAGPAFEIRGCTATHRDVARLVSRLRLINGVQRVTLLDSTRADSSAAGGTSTSSAGTSGPAGGGCGVNAPTFDVVIFFVPLPGALPTTAPKPATPAASTGITK